MTSRVGTRVGTVVGTRAGAPVEGAAPWTPAQLAGLTWLPSSLDAFTLNGSDVSLWTDPIQANNAAQAVAADQPLLVTEADGFGAAEFDRANTEHMSVPNNAALATGAKFTWAYWLRFPANPSSGDYHVINKLRTSPNNQGYFTSVTSTTVRLALFVAGALGNATYPIAGLAAAYHHYEWSFDGALSAGSRVALRLDGVDVTSGLTISGAQPTSLADSGLSLFLGADSNLTSTLMLNGKLRDVVIGNRLLTAEERALLFAFRDPR